MKILFIGDIVGKAGRAAVYARLALLKKEFSIDFTIVNGENIAHGKGITEKLYNELVEKGVDAITLGNHAYSKADVLSFIDHSKSLIRPINMYPNEFGCGVRDFYVKGKTIRIINLIGSVFMDKVISITKLQLDSSTNIIFLYDFRKLTNNLFSPF